MTGDDESAEPMGQESPQDDEGNTFLVPASVLGDHKCKPGDKLTFEVVGSGEDGDVEVKFSDYGPGAEDDGGDFKEGLKTMVS